MTCLPSVDVEADVRMGGVPGMLERLATGVRGRDEALFLARSWMARS